MPLEDTVCDSNYVEYIKKWYEECISYLEKKSVLHESDWALKSWVLNQLFFLTVLIDYMLI